MPLSSRASPNDPAPLPLHNSHNPVDHALHDHHPACGHWSVRHDGHLDYLHDGHAHHWHRDHWDECPPTAEHFAAAVAPAEVKSAQTGA